jgi:hypothetical protein
METALLVLAIVLLLGVLGSMYVLYGALTRVMTALGIEPIRPPKRVSSDKGTDASEQATDDFEPTYEEVVDPGASGIGAEFALGGAATPAASAAGVAYEAPATDYPAAAADTGWSSTDDVPVSAAVDPSGTEETDPSWARGGTPASAAVQEESSVEAAAAAGVVQRSIDEEPDEEPFERDGRWWFKRGGELLVYDEKEGQWQPAPSTAAPAHTLAPNPTSAEAGAITAELASLSDDSPQRYFEPEATDEAGDDATEPELEPELETPAATPVIEEPAAATETEATPAPASSSEEPVQPVTEWQAGSFWKCPSCGAVNGSTAASCRMCFAARA